MCSRRSYLLIVLLALSGLQAGVGQDKPAVAAEGTSEKAELDTELKVFREALLKQGSVDASTVMLFHEDAKAREILLAVLRQGENSPARMAVCKALIQAREEKRTLKNDEDFIEPLLGVFASDVAAEAQLAVQATLVFPYDKIGEPLDRLIKNRENSVAMRVNAIRALRLRRDMMATIKLLELVDELDDADKRVCGEAKNALHSLGIPVGETGEARKQTIETITREGEVAFLRDQLTRQDARMRQTRTELEGWQGRYLSELDKGYRRISEDKAKGEFLAEHLRDKEAVVRSWALDKTYRWRLASQLPDPLGPILIGLISDENRDVRLSTAELLALMQRLNSAQPLLDQHKVEPDDQVKTKLFIALGAACSSAIVATPPAEISPQMKKIRSTTLGLAADEYLFCEDDGEKARSAAEVIRKLLVRDGLEATEVEKYLNLLSVRYEQDKGKPDGALRGALMNAMASLCAPESTCKAKARALFEPLFGQALQDKTAFVREAAVDGLAYINARAALEMLRAGFVNDPSETLRKKLIAMAHEDGAVEDLSWLADKIGLNSEGELAWQAMLSIFRKLKETDAAWKQWVGTLTSQDSKLSREQKIAFLKIAEAKATNESKLDVRAKLGELYYAAGQFEQAADYFGMLYEAAGEAKDRETIFPKLLDACLKGSRVERAVGLVGNHLTEADLDPDGVVIQLLNDYLGKPPLGPNQNAVLKALEEIEVPQERPKWRQWLDGWKAPPSKNEGEESDKPKPPDG